MTGGPYSCGERAPRDRVPGDAPMPRSVVTSRDAEVEAVAPRRYGAVRASRNPAVSGR